MNYTPLTIFANVKNHDTEYVEMESGLSGRGEEGNLEF